MTKTKFEKLKGLAKEFTEHTSMHGLKYIGDSTLHPFERILWVFMFACGVGVSAYLCTRVMQKYILTPSVKNIISTDEELGAYPFPTVTICNQNKISKWKLARFRDSGDPRFSELNQSQLLTMMSVLASVNEASGRAKELDAIQAKLNTAGITTIEMINATIQVMVSCEDMLLDCVWHNRLRNCSDLFHWRPTDDGHCCSFNAIETGWHLGSEKLQPNSEIETIPSWGHTLGLSVVLDANVSDYAVMTGNSNGFKVSLDPAVEFPSVGERGMVIAPGFEVFAGLSPNGLRISNEISTHRPEDRNCYSDQDGNVLEHFSNYSLSRCVVECATKAMISKCLCRPYYIPAKGSDPYCNLKGHTCALSVLDAFRSNVFDGTADGGNECARCLPRCQYDWFVCELSLGLFPGRMFLQSDRGRRIQAKTKMVDSVELTNYLRKNVVVFNAFFKETTGNVYQTDIRFGVGDLIYYATKTLTTLIGPAIGGLLGLGFGFSVISAFELVYYFGIRWFSHKAKRKTEHARPIRDANSTQAKLFYMRKEGADAIALKRVRHKIIFPDYSSYVWELD